MGQEQDREEYEQSLNAWRAKLQAQNQKQQAQTQTTTPHHDHRDTAQQQKPLIDQVTNSWRNDEKNIPTTPELESSEPHLCDLDDDNSCPNVSRRLAGSRRFRRMLAILFLAVGVLYYVWSRYLRPGFEKDWEFKQGFLPGTANGTYGLAKAGDFEGTAIKDIDTRLIPGGAADPDGKRRLIFVGDIHGCKKELLHLLEKVGFDAKHDHLIPTGDVLSKGPDSPGVVDELIRIGAESVRGNHEDRLLEAAKTLSGTDLAPQSAAATSRGYAKDHAMLKQLKPHQMRYLHDMPLILRIPALPLANAASHRDSQRITEDILVVHAGLVPHVPLEKQDPYFVMNMRSIDHRTHLPSALRQTKKGRSKPWIDMWNWYNDRLSHGKSVRGFHIYEWTDWLAQQVPNSRIGDLLSSWRKKPETPRPHVAIYGHDSKMGLQIKRWSKGLDSGCVSGGELTAMVLDAWGKTQIVQVECKNYR